jgi:hypothetical protein
MIRDRKKAQLISGFWPELTISSFLNMSASPMSPFSLKNSHNTEVVYLFKSLKMSVA